jgi:hypothetical protein
VTGSLRYLHTVRGAVNFVLVRAECYLKVTPCHDHCQGESRAHSMLSLVLNPKHVCSAPLTLSGWWLGARTVDTSDQRLVHLPGYYCTELPKAYNDEWDLVSTLSSGSSRPTPPPGVILLPTSFLQNSLHIAMDARGPAIDVSNSGGGRCRTCRQHPPGCPLSTSPTPVLAAVGPADSTP